MTHAIQPTRSDHGLRSMHVNDRSMEPSIPFGDMIVWKPIGGFLREGLYLVRDSLGGIGIRRCMHVGRGVIRLTYDAKGFEPQDVPLSGFSHAVVGIVVGMAHPFEKDLMNDDPVVLPCYGSISQRSRAN